ncbi:T-cell-interacting, activating receptor on myeloid cells protein 1-like [Myotis yumanensis]|uniref:T-cell-interacting, activating receptor on myeloid cells protein 1-like n=1 Tax=Myotis yumanensis TaxID=159337 RepID=UPI0038D41BD5
MTCTDHQGADAQCRGAAPLVVSVLPQWEHRLADRDACKPHRSAAAGLTELTPDAGRRAGDICTTICNTLNKKIKLKKKKNNAPLESSPSADSPEGLAEFHLPHLHTRSAGEHTCEYYRIGSPTIRSPPRDVLLLLVTGELPKPFLHARPGRKVTAGENVILQCQLPRPVTEPHTLALLKKGTSTPIQLQSAVGMETDFSLPSVTGSDTGAYSCVYYQTRAPFWASEPSDELTILVTDAPGATSTDYTTGNLIRLGLSALITVLMVAFLVEAWWSQRRSPSGSSN